MSEWTIEEEAAALKKRFEGVNRAAFARDEKFPGGQAMVYQHIRAIRPISLEAALIYARYFQCPLEEISPRLARELREAAGQAQQIPGTSVDVREPELEYGAKAWPLEEWISLTELEALSEVERAYVAGQLRAALNEVKSRKSKTAA